MPIPLIKCDDCGEPYRRHKGQFSSYRRCNPCARARGSAISAAHRQVGKAIRDGLVAKQACEVCGDAKSVAHHNDYARPLDVRWLCRSHHLLHHSEHGAGANA